MRRALYSLSTLALLGAFACSNNDGGPAGPPPPPQVVSTITVTPASDSLMVGDSVTLAASAKDSLNIVINGTTFTWSSSDTTVATVSATGMVRAVKAGSATISAGASSKTGTATITVTDTAAADVRFSNVFVVGLLEQDYTAIFGPSTPPMPFLDSLAKAGARATNYFGVTHPSIGNFYTLLVGDTVTNDDNNATIFTGDNLIRQLIAAGKTWRSYAESIPSTGYMGSDNGLYIRHHNVAVLLSDVNGNAAQRQNVVPLTRLASDITAGTLPNFGMIVPNECNNTHLCSLAKADSALRATLMPLLASPAFQPGGNGLLIILFDRSHSSTLNGGGKVAWVAVGPRVKAGFTSAVKYQHASTLNLVANSLGLTTLPGASASAPSMSEFLTTP